METATVFHLQYFFRHLSELAIFPPETRKFTEDWRTRLKGVMVDAADRGHVAPLMHVGVNLQGSTPSLSASQQAEQPASQPVR